MKSFQVSWLFKFTTLNVYWLRPLSITYITRYKIQSLKMNSAMFFFIQRKRKLFYSSDWWYNCWNRFHNFMFGSWKGNTEWPTFNLLIVENGCYQVHILWKKQQQWIRNFPCYTAGLVIIVKYFQSNGPDLIRSKFLFTLSTFTFCYLVSSQGQMGKKKKKKKKKTRNCLNEPNQLERDVIKSMPSDKSPEAKFNFFRNATAH